MLCQLEACSYPRFEACCVVHKVILSSIGYKNVSAIILADSIIYVNYIVILSMLRLFQSINQISIILQYIMCIVGSWMAYSPFTFYFIFNRVVAVVFTIFVMLYRILIRG